MERVLRTKEPIEDQLGKPAMLRKEDTQAYLDLLNLFERALKPQDLFGK